MYDFVVLRRPDGVRQKPKFSHLLPDYRMSTQVFFISLIVLIMNHMRNSLDLKINTGSHPATEVICSIYMEVHYSILLKAEFTD